MNNEYGYELLKPGNIILGLKLRDYKTIKFIYNRYLPMINAFTWKNSGSVEDAEDLFQEAMYVIYTKINNDKLVLRSEFSTYLYSVCRYLWLKQLEYKRQMMGLVEDQLPIRYDIFGDNAFNDKFENELKRYMLFKKHFETLHPNCQRILEMHFSYCPHKVMAVEMGCYSLQYIKKRKYQCQELLKKRIWGDPDFRLIN